MKLGDAGREILILLLSFGQLPLKFCHLPFYPGKFIRVFWRILAKFTHFFLRICQLLFQIAVLGEERLEPLFRFLHPLQLSERFVAFL